MFFLRRSLLQQSTCVMNTMVGLKSRQGKDPSEWKLNLQIFQTTCQVSEKLEIDLLASRLSRQLSQYIAWRPDSFSQGTDAMQQNWSQSSACISPILFAKSCT